MGQGVVLPPHIYMPLFEFARINKIPMRALNVDQSLTRQVAERGWENVPEEAREGVGRPAPPLPEYVDFLRDVGKNFRLGTMLAKDTVARRLNSEEGISFTEFSYQVLQGNDFLHLFDEYGCTLEIGGSDQWGNLTSGMDLKIGRAHV